MTGRKINTIAIAYGLILNDLTMTEDYLKRIREAAPEVKMVIIRDQEDWEKKSAEIASEVDIVFGMRPATWFHEMPNLRWGQQSGGESVDQCGGQAAGLLAGI